ncbi:MAG: four-carbon acid sugar kinase family protein [Propioniciclava sp.]
MDPVRRSAAVVLADDLSDAVSVAAMLGSGTPIHLHRGGRALPTQRPVVVDMQSHHLPEEVVYEVTRHCAEGLWRGDGPLLKQVDARLRGSLGAAADALLDVSTAGDRQPVVLLCPSSLDRELVADSGVLRTQETPLVPVQLRAMAEQAPSSSVADVLGQHQGVDCSLAQLRAGSLPELLSHSRGSVVVCDAETADDLTRIADAVARTPQVAVLGAEALSSRVVGVIGSGREVVSEAPLRGWRPTLVIEGSVSDMSCEQADRWVEVSGGAVVEADAEALAEGRRAAHLESTSRIASALRAGDTLLRYAAESAEDVDRPTLVKTTAAAVAAAWRSGDADVMVIGGDVARALLDATAHSSVTVVARSATGGVVCDTGRGSFLGIVPDGCADPQALCGLYAELAEHVRS